MICISQIAEHAWPVLRAHCKSTKTTGDPICPQNEVLRRQYITMYIPCFQKTDIAGPLIPLCSWKFQGMKYKTKYIRIYTVYCQKQKPAKIASIDIANESVFMKYRALKITSYITYICFLTLLMRANYRALENNQLQGGGGNKVLTPFTIQTCTRTNNNLLLQTTIRCLGQ